MQAGRTGKEQGRMEGGREGARGGWGGREGSRGGRKEAMMLGREGEHHWRKGWLREGGLMNGRNEAWTTRGKDGREEASGGGIERGRGSMGREQGREENFKGGIPRRSQASVQYIHKPFHNAALGLESLVLGVYI